MLTAQTYVAEVYQSPHHKSTSKKKDPKVGEKQ